MGSEAEVAQLMKAKGRNRRGKKPKNNIISPAKGVARLSITVLHIITPKRRNKQPPIFPSELPILPTSDTMLRGIYPQTKPAPLLD